MSTLIEFARNDYFCEKPLSCLLASNAALLNFMAASVLDASGWALLVILSLGPTLFSYLLFTVSLRYLSAPTR